MLFKLLSDYRPKGVAVAWDTRPVHRAAQAEAADVVYKEGRRPMADLLREQFPYFRPDRRGVRLPQPRVRGLGGGRRDRDARDPGRRRRDQDVRRLDRPRRVPARLRERLPDDDAARRQRRPGLHARAGRGALRDPARSRSPTSSASRATPRTTSRASPGSATRPPGQLIAQYGSLEGVLEHVEEQSPARRRNLTEFAEQARTSKELATMRRDLELDCDPAELVLCAARPLAAARDVPPLRVPRPARPRGRARRGGAGARADHRRHGRPLARGAK